MLQENSTGLFGARGGKNIDSARDLFARVMHGGKYWPFRRFNSCRDYREFISAIGDNLLLRAINGR